jgi:NodT family efflux transporter outer membrane factor (OMF) lipoprotein
MSGCTTSDSAITSPVTLPPSFSSQGTGALTQEWWTVFGDPSLNQLVEEALSNSPDLRTTFYRLKESRAAAREAGSFLFPSLEAEGGIERTEQDDTSTDEGLLGLSASYEIDLWGGVQARAEAGKLEADASALDLQTAALTLSSEICNSWISLISVEQQLGLLGKQVKANEQSLSLLETRFGQGTVKSVDVLRQRQLLAATRQQLHGVRATRDVLQHQLALLLGRSPQNAPSAAMKSFPDLPPLPDSGLPVDLLTRRPDLQAQLLRVRAANRESGVALSQRFPRLALSASTNTRDNEAEALFDEWARSFAANLAVPLLDAGRRRAEHRQAKAREYQELYTYGQAVLVALRDVENALRQEHHQILIIQELEAQINDAQKALDQLQLQYLNGTGNFIDVLTSRVDYQKLQRDQLDARRLLYIYRINLYRALAGSISVDLEDNT